MRLLLAFVLLVPALSGCMEDGGVEPWDQHGFEALLQVPGGRVTHLVLDGPVDVADRDGTVRKAYRLTEETGLESLPQRVHYLDANLRVVRVDTPCAGFGGDCAHYRLHSWQEQGSLPPHGIGLAWMHQQLESVAVHAGRVAEPVDATVGEAGGHAVVKVGPRTYRFAPGTLVPEAEDQALRSYRPTRPLAKADVWPVEADPLAPAARAGPLFPGSDRDTFGIGFTHDALLAGLRANASEADAMLEDGCVLSYTLYLTPRDGGTLGNEHHEAVFRLGDGGTTQVFRLLAGHDVLGRPAFEVEPQPKGTATVSCTEADRSPWPKMTVSGFLEAAGRVGVDGEPTSFEFARTYAATGGLRPPEAGWDSYALTYIPGFVEGSGGFDGYFVQVEANTGWLEGAMTAPGRFAG